MSSEFADRHAYLITAFNNFGLLETLIRMLDDPRNDIYIHIDRRVRGLDPGPFHRICRYSPVIFVPRVRVHWGHYSQIRSVLRLLAEATKQTHSYYHLLSGTDLPIKPQDQIHEFCSVHRGKEFVGFSSSELYLDRIRWIYLFNLYRRPKSPSEARIGQVLRKLSGYSIALQKMMRVDRTKHLPFDIKKGSDWFSISHQLALHVLANRRTIWRYFRFADIPTEFYIQTLVWNSEFRGHIYDLPDEFASSIRHVDWTRGLPYIFTKDDLPELLASTKLFARKFDPRVDMSIIDEFRQRVLG